MIIVSGLSGSGKSVALQSLEDVGYYCIDNLPSVLLAEFAHHLAQARDAAAAPAAVGIDSRNQGFLLALDEVLNELAQRERACRILFLQADESALLRRYSETRRKHPLTDSHTPLVEGIHQERLLLEPLHDRAERVIDTTDTTPHELRWLVRDFASAGDGASAGPLFVLESFGFKFGAPREADFVFDVRCLPNPHWEASLRALTGRDRAVADYLGADDSVRRMVDEIHAFLANWLPGFAAGNRSYVTVAIGCTGGRHRSVYVVEQVRARFAERGAAVQARHRELSK
ncbi:MAG: RNase adapter RapZ [bacterium]